MTFHNPYTKAEFLQAAPDLAHCPKEIIAEVAFAGRSNAGKSSAINTLTTNKKLARTSKTPGRTQLINFFQIGNQKALVDLPGYGYAKVPVKIKREWERNLSNYLQKREALLGLVLLMDIRHPMQEFDAMLLNWAIEGDMRVHILLTKADKLKKGPAQNTLLTVRNSLQQANVDDLVSVQCFSAFKKKGVQELIQVLDEWFKGG